MSSTPTFVSPLTLAPRSRALRTNAIARPALIARPRRARKAVLHGQRSTIRAAEPATPLEVDDSTFEDEVLKTSETLPVLVDFYAEWCGPCKLVAPLMDWAAAEFDGQLKVVKIDTAKNEKFVSDYAIRGLPTFAVFKKGSAYGLKEGAMGKGELERYINEYMAA